MQLLHLIQQSHSTQLLHSSQSIQLLHFLQLSQFLQFKHSTQSSQLIFYDSVHCDISNQLKNIFSFHTKLKRKNIKMSSPLSVSDCWVYISFCHHNDTRSGYLIFVSAHPLFASNMCIASSTLAPIRAKLRRFHPSLHQCISHKIFYHILRVADKTFGKY